MTDFEDQLRDYALGEWPEFDWARAEFRVGAFHTVIIPPAGPILRVTTGNHAGVRGRREARALRAMARIALPVPIPRALAGPATVDEWSATLITRVPGTQIDDVTTASHRRIQAYGDLLAAFHAAELASVPDLPTPRTWCGGADWPTIVRSELAPRLDTGAQRAATERIVELLDAEDAGAAVICHGDFGPHNILWHGDRPAGLIDLDHACVGDPAIDLAPLIGFHGLQAIRPLADPATLRRAMLHRATLSLQVAAAAHLNGALDLRQHALSNFANRHDRGTLFEPTGLTPADL